MEVTFNGAPQEFFSYEEFSVEFAQLDKLEMFELVIAQKVGPSMTMLRNREYAWLMYLDVPGDSGFVSNGDQQLVGSCSYKLSNGQLDEYPLKWCIDIALCWKAIEYFFVNDGAKPPFVHWQNG
jgi:hypothetical protein